MLPGLASAAFPPAQIHFFKGNTQLDWPVEQAEWKWQKNDEGAIVLRLRATVTLPADIHEAKSQTSTLHLKLSDHHLQLQSGALLAKMEIVQAGTVTPIDIKVTPPKPPLFVSNCTELGLSIKANAKDLPFFVGARCVSKDKEKKKNELHLTVSEEAEVDQSTLFEQEGKGEAWRIYELGKVDAGSQENGRISVRSGDKSYELFLTWDKKGKDEPPPVKQPFEKNFSLGLGYDILNVTGATSGSSPQYLLLLKVLPAPIGKRWGAGADLDVTFGLSQSSNAISHLQFAPYGYYRVVQTKTFVLDPRAYFVIASDQQAGSGVGFHTSQIGLGLLTAYQVSHFWQTHLELMTESFGSKVIKSHYYLDLGLNEVALERRIRWGGGIKMQTYKVQDASNQTYQFGETALYGLVLF